MQHNKYTSDRRQSRPHSKFHNSNDYKSSRRFSGHITTYSFDNLKTFHTNMLDIESQANIKNVGHIYTNATPITREFINPYPPLPPFTMTPGLPLELSAKLYHDYKLKSIEQLTKAESYRRQKELELRNNYQSDINIAAGILTSNLTGLAGTEAALLIQTYKRVDEHGYTNNYVKQVKDALEERYYKLNSHGMEKTNKIYNGLRFDANADPIPTINDMNLCRQLLAKGDRHYYKPYPTFLRDIAAKLPLDDFDYKNIHDYIINGLETCDLHNIDIPDTLGDDFTNIDDDALHSIPSLPTLSETPMFKEDLSVDAYISNFSDIEEQFTKMLPATPTTPVTPIKLSRPVTGSLLPTEITPTSTKIDSEVKINNTHASIKKLKEETKLLLENIEIAKLKEQIAELTLTVNTLIAKKEGETTSLTSISQHHFTTSTLKSLSLRHIKELLSRAYETKLSSRNSKKQKSTSADEDAAETTDESTTNTINYTRKFTPKDTTTNKLRSVQLYKKYLPNGKRCNACQSRLHLIDDCPHVEEELAAQEAENNDSAAITDENNTTTTDATAATTTVSRNITYAAAAAPKTTTYKPANATAVAATRVKPTVRFATSDDMPPARMKTMIASQPTGMRTTTTTRRFTDAEYDYG